MKHNCIRQQSSGDEEDAAIEANTAVLNLMAYKDKGYVICTRKDLVEDLHKRLDTMVLKMYEKVP